MKNLKHLTSLLLFTFLLFTSKTVECNNNKINITEIYNKGEFVDAITIGDSLLFKTDSLKTKFDIAIAISSSYGQLGNYEKAYEYADLANRYANQLNDTVKIIMTSINKVGCFYYLKRYRSGIDQLHELERKINASKFKQNKKQIYDAYSMLYNMLNITDSAIYYAEQHLILNKLFPDYNYAKAIASYCDLVKDSNLCNAEIDTFYQFFPKLNLSQTNLISLYKVFFKYYIGSKQIYKATCYKDSLQKIGIQNAGIYHLNTYYQSLNDYFLLTNDTSNAYKSLLKSNFYKNQLDSINSATDLVKTDQLLKIEKIRLKASLLESSLKQSQKNLIYSIIAIFIILVLLGITISLYNKKHKQSIILEKTANDRSKMISILSHDIRAPLNQLLSMIDLSLIDALSREECNYYFTRLKESTRGTIAMLDNIVQWILFQNNSKQPVNKEVIQTQVLFESIQKDTSILLSNKSINLRSDIAYESVYSDFNYLKVIFNNLVSNAIKFTKPNSDLVFGCTYIDSKKSIWIKDFGKGMNTEQINNLLNGTTFTTVGLNQEKGLGLGMEIVRSSVRQIGATLHIESKPNEGSTFYIFINVNKE